MHNLDSWVVADKVVLLRELVDIRAEVGNQAVGMGNQAVEVGNQAVEVDSQAVEVGSQAVAVDIQAAVEDIHVDRDKQVLADGMLLDSLEELSKKGRETDKKHTVLAKPSYHHNHTNHPLHLVTFPTDDFDALMLQNNFDIKLEYRQ